MWEKGESVAITVGLNLMTYWETTPKQFNKYIKVYEEEIELRFKEQDISNHTLGKYIAYAVNEPKKYPKNPFTDTVKKKVLTGDDLENIIKRNNILLGGTTK